MWLYDDVGRRNLLEPWYVAKIEGLTLAQKKQVTKDILLSMNAQDNHCPVNLDHLSFAKFSDYLANRKLVKSDKNKKSTLLSKSMSEGCRSALMYLYRMSKYSASESFTKDLRQFMSGLKRQVGHLAVGIFLTFVFMF